MKTMYKFIVLVLCFTMVLGLCSCTKEEAAFEEPKYDEEEINSKYESIISSAAENEPIDSGASVIGEKFSLMDFNFTSSDGTVSYNIDANSFVKMALGGTFFNYIAPGNEVEAYDPGYKTARGLTLDNTVAEYFEKYGITDDNSVYVNPDDMGYYKPVAGTFTGKLTVLFASGDGMNFDTLSGDDVQKFLYERDSVSEGVYLDPEKITAIFPEYAIIAAMDITADATGDVHEVSLYRFDRQDIQN